MFLCSLLTMAIGASALDWYAAYDVSEKDIAGFTENECFRGLYGDPSNRSLSLLTCQSEYAPEPFASMPDNAFLCVLELSSELSVAPAQKILRENLGLSASQAKDALLFSGRRELVVANVDAVDELAEYCCETHFDGHVLNARYVPTTAVHPQSPMPKDHPAVQRTILRPDYQTLSSNPIIEDLLSQFSESNVQNWVRSLSTKDGVTAEITRNSYSNKVGVGGCASSTWRCSGEPNDASWSSQTSVFQWVMEQVEDMFKTYPYEWSMESEPFRSDMCPNLVLRLPASVPNAGVIIIGAHLDSRNTMSGANAAGIAPGADDNGSGSAVVLEIARVLAANPKVRFDNDVELQWYCGEEQGLLGSNALAQKYKSQGTNVIGMFNNDMIGYTVPGQNPTLSFMTGAATTWLSNSCKEFAALYVPNLASGNTGACCSDQQSWFNAGFPAAGIFETPTNRVVYPEYHTPQDDFNNPNINYNQIFQFGQANFVCILEYAVPSEAKLELA